LNRVSGVEITNEILSQARTMPLGWSVPWSRAHWTKYSSKVTPPLFYPTESAINPPNQYPELVEIHPLDANGLRERIQLSLNNFVSDHKALMVNVSPDTLPLVESLEGLLAGGKRLRPAFAYWGFQAAGGKHCDEVLRACASLEFLQACALIHDDVMDASDTRRGKPAIHKQFEARHTSNQWSGSAKLFGEGAAILVGDLALSWADEMLLTSGLKTDELVRAKAIYDIMRTELMSGQYLDLLEQVRGDITLARAETVIRFKSAKYTIERPLHLGAAIAGASPELTQILSQYGLALGEAFQLRDDLLGVFGDSSITGKPTGDDLREGKQTMLIAFANSNAGASEKKYLLDKLGNFALTGDEIAELQNILISCGAQEFVENRITSYLEAALASLDSLSGNPEAKSALIELAILATKRSA
jgi:geranylgeranyl diphosphate synthase type I